MKNNRQISESAWGILDSKDLFSPTGTNIKRFSRSDQDTLRKNNYNEYIKAMNINND